MWIVEHIDWVLIVSGVLTCSMLLMALAPRVGMRTTFGEAEEGALARLIARSWGTMIFASGLMLIHAAWHPETRVPILLFSIVGKASFVALLLPSRYRSKAMLAIVVDSVIVVLLAWYLLATR